MSVDLLLFVLEEVGVITQKRCEIFLVFSLINSCSKQRPAHSNTDCTDMYASVANGVVIWGQNYLILFLQLFFPKTKGGGAIKSVLRLSYVPVNNNWFLSKIKWSAYN